MLQVGVAQPQPSRYITAQIRIDRVRLRHQILEDGAACRVLEIDCYAALVPVEGFEEQRILALLERGYIAPDISTRSRILDFNDVRAKIGEVH